MNDQYLSTSADGIQWVDLTHLPFGIVLIGTSISIGWHSIGTPMNKDAVLQVVEPIWGEMWIDTRVGRNVVSEAACPRRGQGNLLAARLAAVFSDNGSSTVHSGTRPWSVLDANLNYGGLLRTEAFESSWNNCDKRV